MGHRVCVVGFNGSGLGIKRGNGIWGQNAEMLLLSLLFLFICTLNRSRLRQLTSTEYGIEGVATSLLSQPLFWLQILSLPPFASTKVINSFVSIHEENKVLFMALS